MVMVDYLTVRKHLGTSRLLFVLAFCCSLLLLIVAFIAIDKVSPLEKSVIQRAKTDPETAPEYFMGLIESHPVPSVEDQAVYMFGIGMAHEEQGNLQEALNDYLSAEALGNNSASRAAKRLQKHAQGN